MKENEAQKSLLAHVDTVNGKTGVWIQVRFQSLALRTIIYYLLDLLKIEIIKQSQDGDK